MTEFFTCYFEGERLIFEPMSDQDMIALFGGILELHTEPLGDGVYQHTFIPRSKYEFLKDIEANESLEG